MKKILLIGTGGTIASRLSDTGLAPAISIEEVLSYIPEIRSFCEPSAISVCNVDSTNMAPCYWVKIVQAIKEHYDDYDGFVISHGTDTLAYTAAALSYMIQNSGKPIVLTGSQRPIDVAITDAKTNLIDSFLFAADNESQNVNIVFDGKVICGTRAKKERAKSYNAFSSINFPYPAVVQDGRVVRYIPETPVTEPVLFSEQMNENICVLKLIPGMKSDILHDLFAHYDCLVIESFGVGGIPETMLDAFYEEMEHYKGKEKYVVITTQVANEGSDMTIYEVGRKVKLDFDLMEAYDMTLEATITKLMWILAKPDRSKEEVQSLFYRSVNHDILFSEKRGS